MLKNNFGNRKCSSAIKKNRVDYNLKNDSNDILKSSHRYKGIRQFQSAAIKKKNVKPPSGKMNKHFFKTGNPSVSVLDREASVSTRVRSN